MLADSKKEKIEQREYYQNLCLRKAVFLTKFWLSKLVSHQIDDEGPCDGLLQLKHCLVIVCCQSGCGRAGKTQLRADAERRGQAPAPLLPNSTTTRLAPTISVHSNGTKSMELKATKNEKENKKRKKVILQSSSSCWFSKHENALRPTKLNQSPVYLPVTSAIAPEAFVAWGGTTASRAAVTTSITTSGSRL